MENTFIRRFSDVFQISRSVADILQTLQNVYSYWHPMQVVHNIVLNKASISVFFQKHISSVYLYTTATVSLNISNNIFALL